MRYDFILFLYFSSIFWGKPVIFGGPFKESWKVYKYKQRRQFPRSQKKEKKKLTSYNLDALALNKILDFLVSGEERDKATLKTC